MTRRTDVVCFLQNDSVQVFPSTTFFCTRVISPATHFLHSFVSLRCPAHRNRHKGLHYMLGCQKFVLCVDILIRYSSFLSVCLQERALLIKAESSLSTFPQEIMELDTYDYMDYHVFDLCFLGKNIHAREKSGSSVHRCSLV